MFSQLTSSISSLASVSGTRSMLQLGRQSSALPTVRYVYTGSAKSGNPARKKAWLVFVVVTADIV